MRIRGRNSGPIATLLAGALTAGLGGCGGEAGWQPMRLDRRPEPRQAMIVAMTERNPDVRREAAAQVSGSAAHREPWAVEGLSTMALLDSDAHTRCVAIRGLARGGDALAAGVLIRILAAPDSARSARGADALPVADVRPAPPDVRWEAALGLGQLAQRDQIADADRAAVETALQSSLTQDRDRNVRIAAAEGLAHFPSEPSVQTLVAALGDPDFAVARQAEVSLATLTGVSHGVRQEAWLAWLSENRETMFAAGGRAPKELQRDPREPLPRMMHNAREWSRWLAPGQRKP